MVVAVVALAACGKAGTGTGSGTAGSAGGSAAAPVPPAPAASAPAPAAATGCTIARESWRFPAVPRVIAVGDVHGDLAAARRALRLARVVDEDDQWVGGATWVVQVGDQLDRGDDEQAILDWFERLEG